MDMLWFYEIRVAGLLTDRWSDWFGDLKIQSDGSGETSLRGIVVDQSALFGVLNKIHALNLTLVSVTRYPSMPGEKASICSDFDSIVDGEP
jgi:hypothetical protein